MQDSNDLTFQDDTKLKEKLIKAQFGALEIQVIDNGCGIKQENQDKLFKLFGFLEDTKTINTKGIGLGLHICQKILQEQGGDIICRSRWNIGTTFVFLYILSESSKCDPKSIKRK